MTRVPYRINMAMQSRTDSLVIRKSLGAALILVFGLLGFDSGAIDVASLYAAEITTAPGHSLIKSDSYSGSRAEGLAVIPTVEPIFKLEKESDRSKVGKKPRRLIRKSLPDESQSEFPQQADQGRSLNAPMTEPIKRHPQPRTPAAGVAKSAVGMSPGAPPGCHPEIRPREHIARGADVFGESQGSCSVIAWFIDGCGWIGWGTSSGGGRSVQNLMKQLPGLQHILSVVHPPRQALPPNRLRPLHSPLGPPQSGLPPAPVELAGVPCPESISRTVVPPINSIPFRI